MNAPVPQRGDLRWLYEYFEQLKEARDMLAEFNMSKAAVSIFIDVGIKDKMNELHNVTYAAVIERHGISHRTNVGLIYPAHEKQDIAVQRVPELMREIRRDLRTYFEQPKSGAK